VKYLVRVGLLPDVYRKQINRSLISKWRREDSQKYYGYELNDNIEELYDVLKSVADSEVIQKRKANKAFAKMANPARVKNPESQIL
jgi:hypothetical protein